MYKGKKKSQEIWQIALDETEVATDIAYEVKAYAKKQDKSSIYLGKTAFLISEDDISLNKDDKKQDAQVEKSESATATSQNIIEDDSTNNERGYYTIMGNSTATVEQMVKDYEAQAVEYPTEALSGGGAPLSRNFARFSMTNARKEGVPAEVAFAQSMLEMDGCNFAGIPR